MAKLEGLPFKSTFVHILMACKYNINESLRYTVAVQLPLSKALDAQLLGDQRRGCVIWTDTDGEGD